MVASRATHPWVAEGQHSIRFAIVGGFIREWSQTLEFVQQAEELEFDAYWANDHPLRSMDCWSTLTALAMATRKIRLLSLVSCIYYRSPVLLARLAADVDRVSNGRLILGVGIGDDTHEFAQMHIPLPPARERQEALEETIQIVRGLWDQAPFTFSGKYFQVAEAPFAPRPVQQPHVPILIAGGGERTTLRQVAQYADMSNFGPHEWTGGAFDLADVQRKLAVLRQHCARIGKPYEAVLRSHYSPLLVLAQTRAALESKRDSIRIPDRQLHTLPLFATVDEAIVHYQALIDAGMQYFLATINGHDLETMRLLAEQVRPALRPAREPSGEDV
ncbi:MAG TPA: LLM class flavin-dependent oxidoreductase [Chloroflexota bacterium]|jgi:alkanesulfonate monooxygenase SsuD/methylene tetrahydromethanopterin reductase-like flavin-dependent oxidoreductase (luciferase family)|nr:LLM class flavin-dependent oxidoreductase [Chloroflexota bacterium]